MKLFFGSRNAYICFWKHESQVRNRRVDDTFSENIGKIYEESCLMKFILM